MTVNGNAIYEEDTLLETKLFAKANQAKVSEKFVLIGRNATLNIRK